MQTMICSQIFCTSQAMCFHRVELPNESFKHTKQEVTDPRLWSYVLKEHVKEEVPAHYTRTILLVVLV